jgi:predicted nicotinamide N-methyase
MLELNCDTLEFLTPYAPNALPEISGGWEEKKITVQDRVFRLIRPANPDALLEDPEVLKANLADNYMPYWGYLWPTSLDMAKAIITANLPANLPTLEIGAGIGLAGLAGLVAGLEVVFTDYDRTSVRLALSNAVLNGFPTARGAFLDWRQAPDIQFPLIFGCDVVYEKATHEPILNVLDHMLAPQGECWLADPGRHTIDIFLALAKSRGYKIERRQVVREPFPTRPAGMTDIWVITR